MFIATQAQQSEGNNALIGFWFIEYFVITDKCTCIKCFAKVIIQI